MPTFFSSSFWVRDAIWAWMLLITSTSIEEHSFDFSVLGYSSLLCSSLWLLSVSLLFWLVGSWASICWILSKASYWALDVCSWASIRWRRSSLFLSAMLADTLPVCIELIVAIEAYPLVLPYHLTIGRDFSVVLVTSPQLKRTVVHNYRVLLPWILCLKTHLLVLLRLGPNQDYSLNLEN